MLVNKNSNETFYYPFTISINKYGGWCNTIDNPYVWACFTNTNVKVCNLMSGVNETKFLVHHESCDCKCGSNKSVWK